MIFKTATVVLILPVPLLMRQAGKSCPILKMECLFNTQMLTSDAPKNNSNGNSLVFFQQLKKTRHHFFG